MRDKYKKKNQKESLFSKFINFIISIILIGIISVQMCIAANNNLRFVQVSDAHFSSFEKNTSYKLLENSSELLDDIILQINTSGAYDFVMFTGDLINKPEQTELEKFIEHANKLLYPWYAIDGNHDIDIDGKLSKKKFMNILGDNNHRMQNKNIYYAFTPKKGYRVIGLDSIIDYKLTSNGEISDEELHWLDKELKNHEQDVIIICSHVPINEPFPSSSHKMNNEYEVKKILKKYNNPIIVLQGHYHCVKIKQDDNLLFITCPSIVTYPNSYRVINIHTNKNSAIIDVYLKETNLKDIQKRSKLRVFGTENLLGNIEDRNASFKLERKY